MASSSGSATSATAAAASGGASSAVRVGAASTAAFSAGRGASVGTSLAAAGSVVLVLEIYTRLVARFVGRPAPVHFLLCLPLQHFARPQRAGGAYGETRQLVADLDDRLCCHFVYGHGICRIGLCPLHTDRNDSGQ